MFIARRTEVVTFRVGRIVPLKIGEMLVLHRLEPIQQKLSLEGGEI